MEDNPIEEPQLALPAPDETAAEQKRREQRAVIIIIAVAVVLALITIVTFVFLMRSPPAAVAQMRDVFIIFLALQSLVIGLALVILLVQLARLINLLQNEVKPILESTNETINNLRGTTTFLTDNLVEPVIRLNEYTAGLAKLLLLLGIVRRK
jgi:membrane protein implicated in regulation of membrane protease activity